MQKAAQRLLLIIIAFGLFAFKQANAQQLPSNFNNCERYETVIDYLLKTPETKSFFDTQKLAFEVSPKVWLSGVTDFMQRQYIAGYLNTSVDSVNFKDPAIKTLVDSVFRVAHNLKSATATCLLSKKNSSEKDSVFLSFTADEVSVTAHLETRGYGYHKGMIYLFFMDKKNKIKRVFKSTWTE